MTQPLKGEWTTIKVNGRILTVWCVAPDQKPTVKKWNDLQVYIGITDALHSILLTKTKADYYSQADIEDWLAKFPKPINSK